MESRGLNFFCFQQLFLMKLQNSVISWISLMAIVLAKGKMEKNNYFFVHFLHEKWVSACATTVFFFIWFSFFL